MAAGGKGNKSSPAERPGRGRPPLNIAERRRILDATTSVFLEKGFARAATNEIARRARTSKQTLYRLFPTKAHLFAGVIGAYTNRLFARHVEFVASDREPRETLNEMGRMMLGLLADDNFLALYRILVAEAHQFPGLARRLWSECMERGYYLLSEYLKSRRIGGPAYRKSARDFIALVLGDFVLNAMLNPDAKLSDRALRLRVRKAVQLFLRLHGAGTARKQG